MLSGSVLLRKVVRYVWYQTLFAVNKISCCGSITLISVQLYKGNELEERLFGHIRKDIDLSQYKAALQAFDIVGFHTFVTYLVNRGPDDDWIKDKHGYIGRDLATNWFKSLSCTCNTIS